jgi:hypothetical protein
MSHVKFRAAIWIILAFSAVGCKPSGMQPCPVTGKVTFQRKPVTDGMIRFSNPTGGVDITALIKPDGAYEILMAQGKGLPPGTYQVAVAPPPVKIPLGPMTEKPKPHACPNIPEKYRDPATSGLTFFVEEGKNVLDIDMK